MSSRERRRKIQTEENLLSVNPNTLTLKPLTPSASAWAIWRLRSPRPTTNFKPSKPSAFKRFIRIPFSPVTAFRMI